MKKALLSILFLVQLAIILSPYFFYHNILKNGTIIKLKIDSHNLIHSISGHYLHIVPTQNFLPLKEIPTNSIHVLFEEIDGFHEPSSYTLQKPTNTKAIKIEKYQIRGDKIYFTYPFDRFYIDEDSKNFTDKPLHVEVRILDEKAVVSKVSTSNVSIKK